MHLPPPTLFEKEKDHRHAVNKHPIRWFAHGSGYLLLLVVLSVSLWWLFLGPPHVVGIAPQAQATDVSWASGFTVHFSKPINRRVLSPTLTPEVPGTWVYEQPLIKGRLFRSLRFIPEHTLNPATTYTIVLTGVTDGLGLSPSKRLTTVFTTSPLPEVATVVPAAGATAVIPNIALIVTLTKPTSSDVVFTVASDPEANFRAVASDDGKTLTLTPAAPLRQGTTYTLTLTRTFLVREYLGQKVVEQGAPVDVYTGSFTTAEPPNLVAAEPSGDHVLIGSPIVLTFSKAMDAASVHDHFSLSPGVQGSSSWSADGTVLTFTPTRGLAYDTEYTVTIPAGTKTQDEGYLEQDTVQQFHTIGPVRVTETVPADGATGIATTAAVSIRFDQAVDHGTAEQRFHITPDVQGALSWDGNTMVFQPTSSLAFTTGYTITLDAGVKGTNGLPSTAPSALSFTTVSETFSLNITIDLQDHPLSCEAAALKMALSAYGIHVTEDDIMAKVGFDTTPHKGNIWGDPYSAFVGNINGKQDTTGYGVYWGPIAAAANAWRPSEAKTGMTTVALVHEVAAGHPVIVWGFYGNGYRDDWITPSGKSILAWKGEHARTVIGFVGSVDAPTKLILNDPVAGRIYWTRDQFENNWSAFGNAAVIVR